MKSYRPRFSIFLAILVVTTIALAIAATDETTSPVTAKELTRRLAAAASAGHAPGLASQLQQVDLGARREAPLTEAGAVTILKSVGVAATTSTPDRLLTVQRANALVRTFGASLQPEPTATGSGAGQGSVPGGVDTCFQEKNHGLCVQCCKAQGGGASSCAKACFVVNKPSADEPLP